jgi:hypothetical protein
MEAGMGLMRWVGIFALAVGILSFVLPVDMSHKHEAKLGDASISVTTHDTEKLPPYVGVVLCAAGAALLIMGSRKATA